MVLWLAWVFALLSCVTYCHLRCAIIEARVHQRSTLRAFVDCTWMQGSTEESRFYRRQLISFMLLALCAIIGLAILRRLA